MFIQSVWIKSRFVLVTTYKPARKPKNELKRTKITQEWSEIGVKTSQFAVLKLKR